MVLCKEWSLVKRKGSLTEVEPLYCKCWHCSTCQPRRSKRLVCEAMKGSPQRFLTLTIDPQFYDSPDEAAQAMVVAWREMRKLICEYYGVKGFPFFAVFEGTKKKWPHMHILLRGFFIPQWLLSHWWRALTGAAVVDIRFITRRRNAVRYVAKYVGKGPNLFPGCKRYWRSMDWLDPHKPEEIPEDRQGFEYSVKRAGSWTLFKWYAEGPYVVDWDGPEPGGAFRAYRVPP